MIVSSECGSEETGKYSECGIENHRDGSHTVEKE